MTGKEVTYSNPGSPLHGQRGVVVAAHEDGIWLVRFVGHLGHRGEAMGRYPAQPTADHAWCADTSLEARQ